MARGLDSSELDDEVTTLVHRYRRGRLLGRGGTSDVYEALRPDETGGDELVLKVPTSDAARVALAREHHVLSLVRHASLVGLAGVIRDAEERVEGLVLGRLHGVELSAYRAKTGAMPWRRCFELLTPVAGALDALHEAGFVHCDVKPANIMVELETTQTPLRVTLFDLGSSLAFKRWHLVGAEGATMATAAYASPEQALGLPLGKTSDVYALAVTAFELLTGVLPFGGGTSEQVLWHHIHDEAPDVRQVAPAADIPPHVAEAIRRGLAKLPAARPATASDFVAALGAPRSAAAVDRQALREWEARRALLDMVRTSWIEGVLQRSAGGLPWVPQASTVHFKDGSPPSEPAARPSLHDTFERASGKLLIGGAAGHGKTIQLLRLLRELLDRRSRPEANGPMPVVFSMSEWGQRKGPLTEWLKQELQTKYAVPSDTARRWVSSGQILPLLDGLDEVPVSARQGCIEAINAFLRRPGAAAVVTCRTAVPDLPLDALDVRGVVEMVKLTDEVTARLLAGAWQPLRAAISSSSELRELARTPLMLHLLRASIRDGVFDALPEKGTPLVEWVYQQFIGATFASSRARTVARSAFEPRIKVVASTMKQLEHGVLLLEELQPRWLRTEGMRTMYLCLSRSAVALLFTLAAVPPMVYTPLDNRGFVVTLGFALSLALLTALFATCAFVLWSKRPSGRFSGIGTILLMGVGIGVASGACLARYQHDMVWVFSVEAGLLAATVMGIARRHRAFPEADVATVEKLAWSWRSVPARTWLTLCAVASVLTAALTPFLTFRGGAFAGLLVGAIGAMIAASRQETIVEKVTPNHGVHRSIDSAARGAAIGFVATFVSVALTFNLAYAPIAAIFPAVVAGLWFGGTDVAHHYVLRLCLAIERSLPLHASRMLDVAVDLGFMRRVGNGYIFSHATLRDHFAGSSHAAHR